MASGNKQPVIHRFVNHGLDDRLDATEVEHHPLVIQGSLQLHVQYPGVAQQAALAVEPGEIHGTQLFDEKAGHRRICSGW